MRSSQMKLAILMSFLGAVSCGVVSQVGYEGVEGADDAFLPLALAFGAIFLGLMAAYLGRFRNNNTVSEV